MDTTCEKKEEISAPKHKEVRRDLTRQICEKLQETRLREILLEKIEASKRKKDIKASKRKLKKIGRLICRILKKSDFLNTLKTKEDALKYIYGFLDLYLREECNKKENIPSNMEKRVIKKIQEKRIPDYMHAIVSRMYSTVKYECLDKYKLLRYLELSKDPAENGKITVNTLREAIVGLYLEKHGLLAGPIIREPSGAAEFIDGNGQAWDVKQFHSENGRFTCENAVANIAKKLKRNQNVILDTKFLEPKDAEALRCIINEKRWQKRILWSDLQ